MTEMNKFKYQSTQTSDYEMKTAINNDYEVKKAASEAYSIKKSSGTVNSYTSMFFQKSIDEQNVDKIENFKKRLEGFKNIKTKEEARELAKKIMPVNNERTVFRIGNAQCIVINRESLFRITLKTKTEYISFNFA